MSELHGHRYCNVLPEAIYCCFTRTTLFTQLFTCLYDQSLRLLSHHQALLLYTSWFLRYNVHCPKLFIVVLQELDCLPNYLHAFMIRVIGCYHVTKFRYSTPSEIAKCIVRGCLLLFYKNYIVYYSVYCCYCGVFIEKYVHTEFIGSCVSELHGHLCHILPEAVCCCFTRTTLFTKLFTCLYDQSLRFVSHHQVLLLYTLLFLR